jgi:hypothetical protein
MLEALPQKLSGFSPFGVTKMKKNSLIIYLGIRSQNSMHRPQNIANSSNCSKSVHTNKTPHGVMITYKQALGTLVIQDQTPPKRSRPSLSHLSPSQS